MKIVLVVGDGSHHASAIAENLGLHGIEAIPCDRDWKLAVRCLTSHPISLVVAAVDKTHESVDFFRTLGDLTDVPIVAFGPSSDADTMIWYLDNGAGDYISAATPMNVFAAKITSRLRESSDAADAEIVRLPDLTIDLRARVITRGSKSVSLTPLEYKLLSVLSKNLGRTCSQKMLLEQVWGKDFGDCRHYLRLYVGYLRQKMEVNPAKPRYLVTDWGHGYRLVDPPPGQRRLGSHAPGLRSLPAPG